MLHQWRFPNQWEWNIILAFSEEEISAKDFLQHFNEKEKTKYGLDDKEFISNVRPPCALHDYATRSTIIWIDEPNGSIENIETLNHEFIHLMTAISENVGFPINENTDECWAYFIGSLNNMALGSIFEYLKEKKKLKGSKNVIKSYEETGYGRGLYEKEEI